MQILLYILQNCFDEVYSTVRKQGYEVVWKDWDLHLQSVWLKNKNRYFLLVSVFVFKRCECSLCWNLDIVANHDTVEVMSFVIFIHIVNSQQTPAPHVVFISSWNRSRGVYRHVWADPARGDAGYSRIRRSANWICPASGSVYIQGLVGRTYVHHSRADRRIYYRTPCTIYPH